MGEVTPTLGEIVRNNGIAGQVSYRVNVSYPGEPTKPVVFVGNELGGPVVMITTAAGGNETQVFVDDPARFGPFGPEWVRQFFGSAPQ
ncbi:hypothetical protein Mycsm_06885 (plasmid) [Mycobacterium sp. JS623]|uniref:hypothetical protein n=1 Tax=Mycobacterium sp. JS623 TaxID=212767 RepID=UPI0002A5A45F|nr:hypothetical protein Mycsm_06885 [Mycobacterium sp. JS623]